MMCYLFPPLPPLFLHLLFPLLFKAKPIDTDPSTADQTILDLLNATAVALAQHLESIGTPLPPPQYGPQDWSLVPCCPRASFDPKEAAAYAREGEWGLAIWDGCVCEREGSGE